MVNPEYASQMFALVQKTAQDLGVDFTQFVPVKDMTEDERVRTGVALLAYRYRSTWDNAVSPKPECVFPEVAKVIMTEEELKSNFVFV